MFNLKKQCGAVISRSFFLQNPQNRHPIVWAVSCEVQVWYRFCRCHYSVLCSIVINRTALYRHSTILLIYVAWLGPSTNASGAHMITRKLPRVKVQGHMTTSVWHNFQCSTRVILYIVGMCALEIGRRLAPLSGHVCGLSLTWLSIGNALYLSFICVWKNINLRLKLHFPGSNDLYKSYVMTSIVNIPDSFAVHRFNRVSGQEKEILISLS